MLPKLRKYYRYSTTLGRNVVRAKHTLRINSSNIIDSGLGGVLGVGEDQETINIDLPKKLAQVNHHTFHMTYTASDTGSLVSGEIIMSGGLGGSEISSVVFLPGSESLFSALPEMERRSG